MKGRNTFQGLLYFEDYHTQSVHFFSIPIAEKGVDLIWITCWGIVREELTAYTRQSNYISGKGDADIIGREI